MCRWCRSVRLSWYCIVMLLVKISSKSNISRPGPGSTIILLSCANLLLPHSRENNPRGLWGCKNRPAPFSGQMLYKATIPGSVCHILACFLLCCCLLRPLLCIISSCWYVFYLLVVLVKLSVLVK